MKNPRKLFVKHIVGGLHCVEITQDNLTYTAEWSKDKLEYEQLYDLCEEKGLLNDNIKELLRKEHQLGYDEGNESGFEEGFNSAEPLGE